MRFVPQPEIYHDEAGGSETHWLPGAYCDAAYATDGLPECVTPDDESSFYYHDHATTFTDNVFVSKTLANMAPALRVGAWTNEAELITGLGIATYVHSERGATVGEEGTAMALDDIERAMLKRRLFEEWKRGVGIGDQAVSPELMGNDRAFWDTIVYSAGEESDAVSAIGEYALGIASRTQLSWEANAQAIEVMTTMTGVRTPLALNLSDATERGRYTFVEAERMQHMKGVSGHWLENRVGHEGLDIIDCPSLENALNRLNLLELGPDDIRMCVNPINQEAHIYSYRVDTAIMTTVQAPPFGWGLRVHSRNFQTGEYTVLTLSVSAVSNLEVAYLTQGKGWHAPLRASTSVGTSTAHLHSRLTIGSLRARPGKSGQGAPDGTEPAGFRDEAPTLSPDVPTAPGGVANVGAAPAPPTTKPGASAEAAERNADHVAAQDSQKLLKESTGWLKLGGPFIYKEWRLLTYWETFSGYVAPVDINTLRGDVDDWLTVTKHNGERIDEARYVVDILNETVRFMSEEWTMPEKLPTMEEWVASGVWMRGKAGTGRNTLIRVEGKEKRTRRYKGVDAALKSDREIEYELCEARRENMKIMQKSEGGKVRPAVVGGNELYRKMDFLSGLVEVGLYGSRTSTLFAGAAGNETIDREWLAEVRNSCTLKVPLDQSSFDNNQSKSTILAVLLGIEQHIMGHAGVPEQYREVWSRMWDTFTTAGVEVIMGNDHRSWENGVPSGWRWTALIDTILNIVSFRVATRYCLEYYGVAVPVGKCTMQGDDVIFTTVSVGAVEALVAMYLTLGYKVHQHKTYISRDQVEFLRRSYECSGITGYTPRTLLALRFRNPIIPIPIAPAERLCSRLALWSLARQRGACPTSCTQMYIEDAVQAGIDASTASAFALTPATYGGAGLEIHEGHMRNYHIKTYGSRQPWIRPRRPWRYALHWAGGRKGY
ncbi:unnamed protein product [Arctia plantaginis]|uniref:RNA-directed RNA polymerase n=1 Tax=Arctia plantaginis TaxID=874455 RepID=A0A8S0Z821_ARCPL|nr:unnamed protein product [Arctia plantaginis]